VPRLASYGREFATSAARRIEREHDREKPYDSRSEFQRDRDRILYASEFRRLADVTQVVSASEGPVFHNRLTHSLEVAQFGRRLAERLVEADAQTATAIGGIDPDVVEAACLAHDIGHPPFGHVAEQELRALVTKEGVRSGFEGNAQSFRIVTKLSPHPPSPTGLNLTRATLNAILKYPWFRDTPGAQPLKWGAYDSEFRQMRHTRKESIPAGQTANEAKWLKEIKDERELLPKELQNARDTSFLKDLRKCPEAVLMDWADDVTYAVHDAVDFYCAGLIPLDRLTSRKDDSERKRFFDEVFDRHNRAQIPLHYSRPDLEQAFIGRIPVFPNLGPYQGSELQRGNLINYSAFLIKQFIEGVTLDRSAPPGEALQINYEHKKDVFMLKQLTWSYVIENPKLATQQYGQRRIIRDLFDVYAGAATSDKAERLTVFPTALRQQIERSSARASRIRIVSDFISGMSERQAVIVHHKLTGTSLGSMLDGVIA
jgi:dGTPase